MYSDPRHELVNSLMYVRRYSHKNMSLNLLQSDISSFENRLCCLDDGFTEMSLKKGLGVSVTCWFSSRNVQGRSRNL